MFYVFLVLSFFPDYHVPLIGRNSVNVDGAYHHPALPFVLHTCFFKGKSPVSRVHRSSFPRYIEATNTEEEKLKITDAMLTFAAVIVSHLRVSSCSTN